jgi:hypothetical protein
MSSLNVWKVAAVAAFVTLLAVLAIPSIVIRIADNGKLECNRLRLVTLSAFMATNPDYAADSGKDDDTQDCDSMHKDMIALKIGPRMASSDAPGWSDMIRQVSPSIISSPLLQSWRMTEVLAAIDEQEPAYERFGDINDLLPKMQLNSAIQVVVYLDEPMSESSVRELWPDLSTVFVSGARTGKPISWESVIWCRFRGYDSCLSDASKEPLVADFQKWVSLLKDEDASALAEFGLTLAELRECSMRGLVYGFTARNLPSVIHEELVRSPRVRAVYLVDIAPPR